LRVPAPRRRDSRRTWCNARSAWCTCRARTHCRARTGASTAAPNTACAPGADLPALQSDFAFTTVPVGPVRDTALARVWRGFMTARIAIALVLLTLLATLFVLVPALNVSRWLIGLCLAYLASALAVRIFTRPSQTS